VKINSIDRLAKLSVSSTMQIGNHVKNRRVEGFGEQNGDFVFLHNQKLAIDDSDFMDAQSSKQG
jgi:hypothetical protein